MKDSVIEQDYQARKILQIEEKIRKLERMIEKLRKGEDIQSLDLTEQAFNQLRRDGIV